MKFTRIILLLAIFSITSFATAQDTAKKTLPDISIKNLEGEAINIQKLSLIHI